jgi:hypothetical protein
MQTKSANEASSPDWRSKRPLLWFVLALGAAGNVVTQSLDVNILISVAFGVLTLACGIALAVDHYRHR